MTPPVIPAQGYSSLGRSIAAYHPVFAAPNESLLDPSNMVGVSALASMNPPVSSTVGRMSGIVRRANRMSGMREMYSRGCQRNTFIRMIATGQVERSRFQPLMGWTWSGSFNDNLYRAGGIPQNLGLTFKAQSVPDGVATSDAWGRMRPSPRITRTIFTRRRFTGAPSLPAQPQQR